MNDKYSEYLMSEHWKETAALRRSFDGNKCIACGSKLLLNVHHISYDNLGHENIATDLITLCKTCHEKLHDNIKAVRRDLSFEKPVITARRAVARVKAKDFISIGGKMHIYLKVFPFLQFIAEERKDEILRDKNQTRPYYYYLWGQLRNTSYINRVFRKARDGYLCRSIRAKYHLSKNEMPVIDINAFTAAKCEIAENYAFIFNSIYNKKLSGEFNTGRKYDDEDAFGLCNAETTIYVPKKDVFIRSCRAYFYEEACEDPATQIFIDTLQLPYDHYKKVKFPDMRIAELCRLL